MFPSSRRFIQYVGSVTLEQFSNPALRTVVKDFCEKQENENTIVKKAEIKGTHLHRSYDDPSDPKPVISIRFRDVNDRRVGTGHVHEDGTGNVNWKCRFPRLKPPSVKGFATQDMDSCRPFEEEQLPWYKPDQFYPVRIGEILDTQYKVLGKLGYGAHSTSWLCRNTNDASFAAVKICTRDSDQSARVRREIQFYEHVSSLRSRHHGQAFIRGLRGTFELNGPDGTHLCLVHPPMHMTIHQLQYRNPSHRLSEQLLRWTIFNMLQALSFLHDEAGVVHADINAGNIMLTVDDQSVLNDFEKAEVEDPVPRKTIDDVRIIYGTRQLGPPKEALWGQPVLCDFGEARIGKAHTGLIQPELYRAPEVLFNMGWGSSADIWNVAVMIWDLLENRHLFEALDEDGKSSATHHVAEMVGYLGLPPLEYIRRSEITKKVFDDQGLWKGAGGTVIPQRSLEETILFLDGLAKEEFLGFVRKMLRWLPEERMRASELLQDPWINKGIS